MNKLYDRIDWNNNTTPALNESNLNAMSKAIDDIDDRVIDMGAAVYEVIPELEDILSHAEELEEYRDEAQAAAESADEDKLKSEGYAVGEQNGVPVESTSPYYHNNAKYYSQQSNPTLFANLQDVDMTGVQDGNVPVYDAASQKYVPGQGGGGAPSADDVSYNNTASGLTADNVQDAIDELNADKASTDDVDDMVKVTTLAVDLTGWTSDTTSQSGVTLYKKQISLNNVYASPSVDIGAGTGYVLPTSAEQESYDLLQYVTVDDAVPCLYLYASDIPTTAFYISVKGVD